VLASLIILCRIKTHIEPLAIAVNINQEQNTRCDQVLLGLGNLYRIYVNLRKYDRTTPDAEFEDKDHPVTAVINSIEKRWAKADQDLFIACLFLNPFIKTSLFNPQKFTLSVLIGIIRRLYTRVFRLSEPHPDLIREIFAYAEARDIFSEQMWPITDLREALKDPKV
jgi:hypothetical protein